MTKKESVRLPQMSEPEDRETHISINHGDKTILVYTNHITVVNRFTKKGFKHFKEELLNGKVYSRSYELPILKMNEIMMVTNYR